MKGKETFEEATRAHEAGDVGAAIAAYRALLRGDPAQADVLTNLGIALCQSGDPDAGIRHLNHAVSLSDDPAIRYDLGYALLEAGRYGEAVGVLTRAAAAAPDDAEIQEALAEARDRAASEARQAKAAAAVAPPIEQGDGPPDTAAGAVLSVNRVQPDIVFLSRPANDRSPDRICPPTLPDALVSVPGGADAETDTVTPAAAAERKAPASAPGQIFEHLDVLENLFRAHGLGDKVAPLDARREALGDPSIRVFVIGEGKFGKSNLINHLLGVKLADVHKRPMTWRVDFYRAAEGGTEYAEVQRHNRPGTERLTVKEADDLCQKEGEVVLGRGQTALPPGETGGVPTLVAEDGQIVRVDWHRARLALDKRVTLVDTPGFAQPRGAARATEDAARRSEGVVVDLGDAFEFDKADLVLWALKATKLEDTDTEANLKSLTRMKIPVLGVITHWDKIDAADRPDRMREARQRYGAFVTDLLCVGCPDKDTPEVTKEGIPELRAWLKARADGAAAVKISSARAFCAGEARQAAEWLQELGDGLIRNVAELALYCNEASDLLLRGIAAAHEAVLEDVERCLDTAPQNSLVAILESRVPQTQKQQRLAELLRVSDLNASLAGRLGQVGRSLTAEGTRLARRRTLVQVVLRERGASTLLPLKAQIDPPQMEERALGFEGMAVPAVEAGLMDLLFDAFQGSWLGSVAEAFGGRSAQERRAQALETARAEIRRALALQVDRTVTEFTKAAAEAVLASVDSGVQHAYPGRTLPSLRGYARSLDEHAARLPGIDPSISVSPNYESHFTLWSPVDDGRQVVLGLFCAWFARQQASVRVRIAPWGDAALVAGPPAASFVYACVRARLAETDRRFHVDAAVPLASLASERVPRLSLARLLAADSWLGEVAGRIKARDPFGGQAGMFLADAFPGVPAEAFEHFRLDGLGAAFSERLAGDFLAGYRTRFAAYPPLDITPEAGAARFMPARRLATRSALAAAAAAALVSGLPALAPLGGSLLSVLVASWHGADLLGAFAGLYAAEGHAAASTAFAAVRAPAGVLVVQYLFFLRDKNRFLVSTLTGQALLALRVAGAAAWEDVVETFTPEFARALASEYTLVGLRPLDYARDGLYQKYADERPVAINTPELETPGTE